MAAIYLSSTVADLVEHRARLIAALRHAGHEVVAMEDYAAREERPFDASRADIETCDLYVAVLAWRYGHRPARENPEALSITELEYRHARGRPRFVFLLDEQVPWRREFDDHVSGEGDGGACIDRFRARLAEARWAGRFRTAEDLARQVVAAVARQLGATGRPVPETPLAALRSPYPGLVALGAAHAPIFFGRDPEIGELLERMTGDGGRLQVIVGASGTGKSSLIGAGLLPRLAEGAIAGSEAWAVRALAPGKHRPRALRSLAGALQSEGADVESTLAALQRVGQGVDEVVAAALHDEIPGAELLLVVDPLEEVFACEDAARFLGWLVALSRHPGARVVAAVRAELFHRCLGYADFAEALRAAVFPLGVPLPDALRQMVREPARRAEVELSSGLVARIVADTLGERGRAEPGALALVAFTMKQLWRRRELGLAPTLALYEALGGVVDIVGRHAEHVLAGLDAEAREALPGVFNALVEVSPDGIATRRRVALEQCAGAAAARRLVDALAQPETRLLVRRKVRGTPLVELAHDALLRCWPPLAEWIAEHPGHVRRVREAERIARAWAADPDSPDFQPWAHERQKLVYESLARLGRRREDEDEPLRQFLQPEAARLLQELADPALPPARRASIGEDLARIGDPRPGVGVQRQADGHALPDIDWVAVPGGVVELEGDAGAFEVESFHVARFPVTSAQFAAFVADAHGYAQPRWWQGFEAAAGKPARPSRPFASHPRETVNWYEAVAFCRWLTARLVEAGELAADLCVRLPTEWEWQQAATGGEPYRAYPWGAWDEELLHANVFEARLGETTAVGVFPADASRHGLHDLAGNVREWCLNRFEDPSAPGAGGVDGSGRPRACRGGSWSDSAGDARCGARHGAVPDSRLDTLGFRVCCASAVE